MKNRFNKTLPITMATTLGLGSTQFFIGVEDLKVYANATRDRYVVKAAALNVRTHPTTIGQKLGLVMKNEVLVVEKELENGWLQIQFQGKRAYVCGDYVAKVKDSSSLPSNTNKKYEYVVNASALNVRDCASVESKRIGKFYRGERLKVLSEKNGWLEIDFGARHAYVSSKYVRKQEIKEPVTGESEHKPVPPMVSEREYVVTASRLNVRVAPTVRACILDVAVKGQKLKVVKEMSGWYELEYGDTVGYVSSGFVKPLLAH